MARNWGVARFSEMGSMEYLLESGEWLSDRRLFDAAPIRLFDTMAEADAFALQLAQDSQPHGVQFMVDDKGKVVTARKKQDPVPRPRR